MTRRPISLCVITQDEADRIGDCLASAAPFCDDLVVVDGGSTDDTVAIARQAGARVISRPFDGFRSQKAFAVAQAANDWVLCLDADERIGADLRAAIEKTCDEGFHGAAGFRFYRRNDFFGRFMRHGNAGADKVLRLFDRRQGGWRGPREIHESVSVDGEVRMLPGFLDHYPYRSLSELMAKQERYAHMMATEEFAAGKRATLAQIIVSPMWRFFRGYVLRAGFLDGWRGIVYALLRVEYVRRKYVKLWLLQHGQKA
ncbi:glycosyltransferase family 2 protein [Luteibacter sp. E-22]|uniref:glycosyltransferase family 2 protein n=1 Tax=Luteibacter sp. E-22 TaxID=3404050 RepID=UPI003CF5F84F